MLLIRSTAWPTPCPSSLLLRSIFGFFWRFKCCLFLVVEVIQMQRSRTCFGPAAPASLLFFANPSVLMQCTERPRISENMKSSG